MTKRELAALACKVLAIYALFCAIGQLSFLIQALIALRSYREFDSPIGTQSWLPFTASVVPCVLYLLVALFLWCGADTMARQMVHDDDALPHVSDSPREWHKLVYLAVGVFTLANVIPSLGGHIIHGLFYNSTSNASSHDNSFSPLPSYILRLLIGLWLTFGALSPGSVPNLGTTPHYGDARDDAVE